MMLLMLLGALFGPSTPDLRGLKACTAEAQPFSLLEDTRADWFWSYDRIVIGQVVWIGPGKTLGDGLVSFTSGQYRLRQIMVLKGPSGNLPKGDYESSWTDDGQSSDTTPPVGQLQVYVERGKDKGWLQAGDIRCLPVPPA